MVSRFGNLWTTACKEHHLRKQYDEILKYTNFVSGTYHGYLGMKLKRWHDHWATTWERLVPKNGRHPEETTNPEPGRTSFAHLYFFPHALQSPSHTRLATNFRPSPSPGFQTLLTASRLFLGARFSSMLATSANPSTSRTSKLLWTTLADGPDVPSQGIRGRRS